MVQQLTLLRCSLRPACRACSAGKLTLLPSATPTNEVLDSSQRAGGLQTSRLGNSGIGGVGKRNTLNLLSNTLEGVKLRPLHEKHYIASEASASSYLSKSTKQAVSTLFPAPLPTSSFAK